MSVIKFKITSKNLPKGSTVISSRTIRKSRRRIDLIMQETVKEYNRKRKLSIEKASKTVVSR
jgi:hypothetical protein